MDSGDASSGMPLIPTARALWLHWLHQRHTIDWTLLLQQLVAVAEELVEDAQACQDEDLAWEERWWAEDIARKEAFWAKLLAMEWEQIQVLLNQNTILVWAVQGMDNDYQILDTILGLVDSFMPAAAWLQKPGPTGTLATACCPKTGPHLGLGPLPPPADRSPWLNSPKVHCHPALTPTWTQAYCSPQLHAGAELEQPAVGTGPHASPAGHGQPPAAGVLSTPEDEQLLSPRASPPPTACTTACTPMGDQPKAMVLATCPLGAPISWPPTPGHQKTHFVYSFTGKRAGRVGGGGTVLQREGGGGLYVLSGGWGEGWGVCDVRGIKISSLAMCPP